MTVLSRLSRIVLVLSVLIRDGAACILSLDTLAALERSVTDVAVFREYIICPNNEFVVGSMDFTNTLQNGTDMIHIRPNMALKCGEDGKRENACVVRGGHVQVDGTPFFGMSNSSSVDNVTISGITFEGSRKHSVWINKPGHVVFQDCEFRDNTDAVSIVFADYSSSDESELTLTFEYTTFSGNLYSGPPAQPAVIVGNGISNRLVIENCKFMDNDMMTNNTQASTDSFLIETSGPLSVHDTCFTDNKVGVAPIMTYNAQYSLVGNYLSNSAGGVCSLSGHITSTYQYLNQKPSCTSADASTCLADGSIMPTRSPNSEPVPTPTPRFDPAQPTAESGSSNIVNPSSGVAPSLMGTAWLGLGLGLGLGLAVLL